MALTKIVTRVFPDANQVGYHLELKDVDDVVIDRNYMEQFAVGVDIPTDTKTKIGKRMQADIDKYISLKAIHDNQKYIDGETQISAGLNL